MQTAVLLKYGQKEHLQEILNGNLYLKCIQFFKENGKDSIGRLDKNENLTDVWRYPQFNGKLLLNGMEIGTFRNMNIYIPEHDKDFFTHISSFCLILIDSNNVGINKLICKKMKKFGEHVLFIHNVPKFQEIIKQACEIHPEITKMKMDKIEYISKTKYHGSINIFNKFDDLTWQQEYRIAVQNIDRCKEDHFFLKIEDISNIATVIKADDLGWEYYISNNPDINVYFGTKNIKDDVLLQ